MKKRFKYAVSIAIFLGIYYVSSWGILFIATKSDNLLVSFGLPLVFGTCVGAFLLYIFNHDNAIKIAKFLEDKERKVEQKWLKRFAKTSKFVASIAIATFGGPILGALTVRILLPKYKYRYFVMFLGNLISTIYFILFLKGTLGWIL